MSNLIYRFHATPIKIPANYFVGIDKPILKSIRRGKQSRIAKSILKENKVRGLILPKLKTYCKATAIKTALPWQKNRQIDQWQRIESPEIDPFKYDQPIFDEGAIGYPYEKKMNLLIELIPFTKSN